MELMISRGSFDIPPGGMEARTSHRDLMYLFANEGEAWAMSSKLLILSLPSLNGLKEVVYHPWLSGKRIEVQVQRI